MKIHTDYLTVQTKEKREISNITQNLKFAVEKSGIRDGIVVVAALHSNSAVFIAEDDPGLHRDLEHWLEKLAPQARKQRRHPPAEPGPARPHRRRIVRGPARPRPLAADPLRRPRRPAPQAHPHQTPGRIARRRLKFSFETYHLPARSTIRFASLCPALSEESS